MNVLDPQSFADLIDFSLNVTWACGRGEDQSIGVLFGK